MADPFDALRLPAVAVDPDPGFAAALRARLVRALVPDHTHPGGSMTLVPYLAVADARAALAFYAEAFGAVPHGEPYLMPDGRIGHAEVDLGGAVLMLADEFPEMGLVGPLGRGGVSQSLHLSVPDVDAVLARAVAAGGELEREPADAPYGRTGVVRDPAGHRWMVQTPAGSAVTGGAVTGSAVAGAGAAAAGASTGRHGDVGYQSILAPDVERTKAFFTSVLGWTYTDGDSGFQAVGVTPMTGLASTGDRPEVQLCFQVDDAATAVERVRGAGGTAQDPSRKPYGLLAECSDDQGMRFQVWQPPA